MNENFPQPLFNDESQEQAYLADSLIKDVKNRQEIETAIELAEEQQELNKRSEIKEKEIESVPAIALGYDKKDQKQIAFNERSATEKEIGGSKKSETEKVKKTPTSEKQLEKSEKKKERYGFKDSSIKKTLAKGVTDTVGSIFGARLAWELPKLVSDVYKKKDAENATKDLLESVIENNIKIKNNVAEGGEKESTSVKERIYSFNEKLKNIKLPEKEKQELRDQMAKVLNEHRHSTEQINEKRAEKVADVFDVYANNSAQMMTVAKEAVNTTAIFTMMPWLRGVGYTALAGVDSVMKASNAFDKQNFGKSNEYVGLKERLSYIAKSVTIGSAKETYDGLIGNFYKKNEKGEKMSKARAMGEFVKKAVSFGGGALRLYGVYGFEKALASGDTIMTEGGQKFMEAMKGGQVGEALKQGGENWKNNAERLLSFLRLSENPDKAMRDAVKSNETKVSPKLENKNISSTESVVDAEKVKLATIGKGEGVIHAFRRQIEHDPKAFGYNGNIKDGAALHKFASDEAYKIAVEKNYVDLKNGTETLVRNAKGTSQFILNSDHSVREINPDTYVENVKDATKKSLDNAITISHNAKNFGEFDNFKNQVHGSDVFTGRKVSFVDNTEHVVNSPFSKESLDNNHLNHVENLKEATHKVVAHSNIESSHKIDAIHAKPNDGGMMNKITSMEAQYNKDNAQLLEKLPTGLKESIINSNNVYDINRIDRDFSKLDYEHQKNVIQFISNRIKNAHDNNVDATAAMSKKLYVNLTSNKSYLDNFLKNLPERTVSAHETEVAVAEILKANPHQYDYLLKDKWLEKVQDHYSWIKDRSLRTSSIDLVKSKVDMIGYTTKLIKDQESKGLGSSPLTESWRKEVENGISNLKNNGFDIFKNNIN